MNATRARHLENALLHYDVSKADRNTSIPIDLFLRRYFAAHKHLKDRDMQFISEHMYDLVRWRGLLDQVGGIPFFHISSEKIVISFVQCTYSLIPLAE